MKFSLKIHTYTSLNAWKHILIVSIYIKYHCGLSVKSIVLEKSFFFRGQDHWMTSPTQYTWFWANSRRWWRIRKPGVLHYMEWQRVRHDWETEQQFAGNSIGVLFGLYYSKITYFYYFLASWFLTWCKISYLMEK